MAAIANGTFGVSIHAPTRGATALAVVGRTGLLGFNSRAHEGRDMSLLHAT